MLFYIYMHIYKKFCFNFVNSDEYEPKIEILNARIAEIAL